MSGNEKKKVKGSVLYTVVAVMSIMTVLVFAAMTLAASANRRVHSNYANNQTQYTAKSVLDVLWAEITDNESFLTVLDDLKPGGSTFEKDVNYKEIELSTIDPSMAMGEIVDNKAIIYRVGKEEDKLYKISVKVKMMGQENELSVYYSTKPPEREPFQYGLKSIVDVSLSSVNLLGGSCFSTDMHGMSSVTGNVELESPIHAHGSFEFLTGNIVNMYQKKGMFICGNMVINNGTVFNTYLSKKNLNYRELPYIHTYEEWCYGRLGGGFIYYDGSGSNNMGSADAPVLVISRGIDFNNSAEQIIYGDMYLYGNNDVSHFGSKSGARSWNANNILAKTERYSGAEYTGGNVYSLGEINVNGASASDKPLIGNNVVAEKLVLENSGASANGAVVAKELRKPDKSPGTPSDYYNMAFDKGIYVDPDKYLQKESCRDDRLIYYPELTATNKSNKFNIAWNTMPKKDYSYISFSAKDNFLMFDADKKNSSDPNERYDSVDVTRITIKADRYEGIPNTLNMELKFMYKTSEPGKQDKYDDIDMGGGEGYTKGNTISVEALYDWGNGQYFINLPKSVNLEKDKPNRVIMFVCRCNNAFVNNAVIGLEVLTHTNDNAKNVINIRLKKDKDDDTVGFSDAPWKFGDYYENYKLKDFSNIDILSDPSKKDAAKEYYGSVIPSKLIFNTAQNYESITLDVNFYEADTLKQISSKTYCAQRGSGVSDGKIEIDLKHPARSSSNPYNPEYQSESKKNLAPYPYGPAYETEIYSDFKMVIYIRSITKKGDDGAVSESNTMEMGGYFCGVQLCVDVCKTVPLNKAIKEFKDYNDEKFSDNSGVIVIEDVEKSVKLEKKADGYYISVAFLRDVKEEGQENSVAYSEAVKYTDYASFLKAVTQTVTYPDSFATLNFYGGGVINKALVSNQKYQYSWNKWTPEEKMIKRIEFSNDESIFVTDDDKADYNKLCFIDDTGLYGNFSVSSFELDISEHIHKKFFSHEKETNNRVYELGINSSGYADPSKYLYTDKANGIDKEEREFKDDELVIGECCTIKGTVSKRITIDPQINNVYIKLDNVTVNSDITVDDSHGGVVNFLIAKESGLTINANIYNLYYKNQFESMSDSNPVKIPGNPLIKNGYVDDPSKKYYVNYVDREKIPDIYFYGEMEDMKAMKNEDGTYDRPRQEEYLAKMKADLKPFQISGGHIVTGYIMMISGKLITTNDGSGYVSLKYYTDEVPIDKSGWRGNYKEVLTTSKSPDKYAIIGACFFGNITSADKTLAMAYVNPNPKEEDKSPMGQPKIQYYQLF